MKTLVTVLLVTIAGVLATDGNNAPVLPDPSWARPVFKSSLISNLTFMSVSNDQDCKAPYSCVDCKSARVCKPMPDNGVFSVVSVIQCPADRPYCDKKSGTCVNTIPGECGGDDTNFVCMRNGRFPDKECSKFHVCVDLKPTLFECSIAGQHYDPVNQICSATAQCGSFDCSSVNFVKKVPHSQDERYFAFCNNEANGVVVVDSCPPHFKLDSNTQSCVPHCSDIGIIPDPTDCHFYYKCSQVKVARDISYMSNSRMKCPPNQAYSPKEFLCVDEQQVEECKTPPK